MKVGIVGVGFVGDAVKSYFERINHNLLELFIYDKFKDGGIGDLSSILKTDLVYLCLPTLFNSEDSSYDMSAIHETMEYLRENKYEGIILLKSTVEPGRTVELTEKYNLKIIHNPEFLTARTAREDFANQTHIVLGINELVTSDDLCVVKDFYHFNFPNAEISTCTCTESEAMKIFANSFYAIKVQAFNEFYLLSNSLKTDYNKVVDLMLKNGWINQMHTNVPGPDGKLSYGGACFPKDTNALLQTMRRHQTPHAVLEATVSERNEMRSD